MKEGLIPIVLSYIVGIFILGLFMLVAYKTSFDAHTKIIFSSVENNFYNSLNRFKDLANSTYKAKFENDEETKFLLYEANIDKQKREKIRKLLYEKYKSDYDLLKNIGVKQFQIHLKDNITSFIRFHKPNLWGDSLRGIRKTVEMCLTTGKPVYGFEEGRVFSGFRNVFPIFYKEKVVASVEISIGLNAIAMEAIMDVDKDYAKFILRRDLYGLKVWSKELEKKYKISQINENFVEDKSDIEYIWQIKNRLSSSINLIEKQISTSKELKKKLFEFKKFYVMKLQNGSVVFVFFIPFKDIDKNYAGYFVYFKNDESFIAFLKFFVGVGFILFIIYTTVFFLLLRQHMNVLMLRAKDQLTGAWQKKCGLRFAEKMFKSAKKGKRPLSIIFIDIDDFKKINDTYGHKAGDKVLSKVAEVISQRIRKSDVFLRYGGEELVVILPDATLEDAYKVAEDIRKRIEEMFVPPVGRITLSAGVAQLKEGDSLTDVMHKADEAMYKAKKSGKNRVEKYEES